MIPGTLIIKLSWTTIVSDYKKFDSYGNLSLPFRKPGNRG